MTKKKTPPPAPKTKAKKTKPTMVVTSETGVTAIEEDFLDGPGPRIPVVKPKPGELGEHRLGWIPLAKCLSMAHPNNPKDHDIEALIGSFIRFGFRDPPEIDEATETMVAGHGRCEALEAMDKTKAQPPRGIKVAPNGEWLVPVVRGLSFENELERDAYIIAANQHTINGGWKFDVLTEMLGRIGSQTELGTSGLGFEQVELDNLLGNYREDSTPSDGFDPEDVPAGEPEGRNKPRTEITARIECPNCKHVFER